MVNDYKVIIKNKTFVYIWLSQIFSQLTINMMNFVLLTRLFEVTGSAISTSLLWVSYALPAILFGPFASVIIDLVDKRKILIITNLLQALTIFLYAISTHSTIFVIYEVVFIYSLLNQFYVPSEASILPYALKADQLAHGNSLFFITQQGSLILGFALAGILKGLLGFTPTLFVCSASVFIAFVSTLFLPSVKVINKKMNINEESVLSFFKHIEEGYFFIKNERKVLTPVLLLLGFQVALQLCIVQFPAFAKNILNIPLNSAGFYILIPAGIGAITAAVTLPRILKRNIRKKTIIDSSLVMIAVSLMAITFVAPLFSIIIKSIITLFMFVVLGYGFVGILVPSQTFLQESTPETFRGRVFGSFTFLVTAISVLPVIFLGSFVEILGIKSLILLLSLFVAVIYIASKKFGNRFLSG